jgi:hypothetical protein
MWRELAPVLGGLVGAVFGMVVWLGIGSVICGTVAHRYPPGGAVNMPSPQHIDAMCFTWLMLPLGGVVGGWAGVGVARRMLVRNDKAGGSSPPVGEE